MFADLRISVDDGRYVPWVIAMVDYRKMALTVYSWVCLCLCFRILSGVQSKSPLCHFRFFRRFRL